MLLAAQLSPSPTIVPIFSPEDAVVLTSPVINDWEEYELSNGDRVENDFPFAEDDDGDGPADAPLTNDDTFRLHSNPDSTYKIFLDFDGAITENTNWNNGTGIPTLIDIAYDRNSNPGVFNNSELNQIREIWRLVAEDYAPFDVDVTTEDPGTEALRRANGTDFEYGIRSIHTSNTNQVCSGCGGVAYVGSFDSASDLPAYNFNKGINGGGNTQSHEIGHAVSLSHDGLTGGTTYYSGHGTGDTAWAPIMGSSFGTKITTFSNGDYFNANQQQDDLNRIVSQNGFGYRDDDHGNTFAVATPLQISGRTGLSSFGIIERNTDVDLFSFETAAGNVSFTISPHENYQNLDVWAGIYDAAGLLVAESNPSGNTTASFSNVTLAAGKYFLKVEGVGTHGFYNAALDKVIDPGEVDYTGPETTVPWDVSGPVGYSDYASLGQYWITGTRAAAATNLISIAPQDSEKSEGTSGSTPFTFRVSRLGAGGSSVQVDYAVVTASPEADNNVQPFTVSPADFVSGTLETGVITIPAGQPSVDFTIDVAGDSVFERDEHFQVVISNPTSGWTISDSVADATILSDESSHGVASINTADSTKEEGDPSTGAASYTYTLFRRGDTSVTTSANWQVQYGGFSNAANNADFAGGVRPQGTVTFSPGETEKQIDILLAADLDVEGDESFSVVVTGASGPNTALVDSGTPSQRGIIFEDESPVSVIDQVQFRWRQNRNGSNNADAWAIDNVSLSGTSFSEDFDPSIDASLWADLENANVNSSTTIFPGSDGNKLLMRGSGDRVATTVGLQPTSGAVLSFDIILGDGTGANGNGADNVENGKFIILEYSVDGQNWDFLRRMNPNDFETWSTVDVTLPARAILTPKVITEGDGGSQSVQFNIVRTGNRGKTASADWQVVPSGVNPIDLDDVGGVYPSGTVNFGLNDGVEVVTVPIVGDLIPESDETFDIIVTSANSGPITGGPRTITIVNDDAPSVDSVIINEGAVTRSAVTKVEVVFDTLVDAPPSAFSLTNLGTTASPGSTPVTGLAISSDSTGPVTIVSISLVSGGSLADGNYRLDIDGSQVSAIAGGLGMAGDYVYGDDAADDFFRRYGDSNGDGSVNFTDFSQHFLPAFATTQAGAGAAFRWDLDLNEDGAVNFTDFSNGFLPNFATSR
tara:strand:+ start:93066 stop:96530 length:3465 start_codon:yes stop_codon:yes gene_type:complete